MYIYIYIYMFINYDAFLQGYIIFFSAYRIVETHRFL